MSAQDLEASKYWPVTDRPYSPPRRLRSSEELKCVHPHPCGFCCRVPPPGRFESDRMAARCQSRSLKQHGLCLRCRSVGIDFTHEHTVNEHFSNSGPFVFETNPPDSCAGKSETNSGACIEGEDRGSAAVHSAHIREPLTCLFDGATVLLNASKRAVRTAGAGPASRCCHVEGIDPDPALGGLRASTAGNLDGYVVISGSQTCNGVQHGFCTRW